MSGVCKRCGFAMALHCIVAGCGRPRGALRYVVGIVPKGLLRLSGGGRVTRVKFTVSVYISHRMYICAMLKQRPREAQISMMNALDVEDWNLMPPRLR